jgi:hypothetical protein
MTAEMTCFVNAYTIKYVTGTYYPQYLMLNILPSYRLTDRFAIEGGIGTGLTTVSDYGNANDPLFTGWLGGVYSLGKWGVLLRYYRFLRPIDRLETVRGTRTFGSHGLQLGATYRLFGQ